VKPRLYLETTVPSYLTSRPSRDLIIAGHQQITRDWWETGRHDSQLYISQLVVDEARAGDPIAARKRLKVFQTLPSLDITPDVAELASDILASRKVPRKSCHRRRAHRDRSGARHGFPGNLELRAHCECGDCQALIPICREHACECPVICTPEELLGE
jgi:hypothetical protein